MRTIKVKNLTTLTDYSALTRAALFLSGHKLDAEEGGFVFSVTKNEVGTVVKIAEKRK